MIQSSISITHRLSSTLTNISHFTLSVAASGRVPVSQLAFRIISETLKQMITAQKAAKPLAAVPRVRSEPGGKLDVLTEVRGIA